MIPRRGCYGRYSAELALYSLFLCSPLSANTPPPIWAAVLFMPLLPLKAPECFHQIPIPLALAVDLPGHHVFVPKKPIQEVQVRVPTLPQSFFTSSMVAFRYPESFSTSLASPAISPASSSFFTLSAGVAPANSERKLGSRRSSHPASRI